MTQEKLIWEENGEITQTIREIMKETIKNIEKRPENTVYKDSEISLALNHAQGYLMELNSAIYRDGQVEEASKDATHSELLFPQFDDSVAQMLIDDHEELLKYFPYIMTAYYWNSQEKDIKYKTNRYSQPGGHITDFDKNMYAGLFSLESAIYKATGNKQSNIKLKAPKVHQQNNFENVESFLVSYREILETYELDCYAQQYGILSLLYSDNLSAVEDINPKLEKIIATESDERKEALTKLLNGLFSKNLIWYPKANPSPETMSDDEEPVSGKIRYLQKARMQIREDIKKKNIKNYVETKLMLRENNYKLIPFWDRQSQEAQKLCIKSLYFVLTYCVFVLASTQDERLREKIDYPKSYQLIQGYTQAFHTHASYFESYSLDEVNKSLDLWEDGDFLYKLCDKLNEEAGFFKIEGIEQDGRETLMKRLFSMVGWDEKIAKKPTEVAPEITEGAVKTALEIVKGAVKTALEIAKEAVKTALEIAGGAVKTAPEITERAVEAAPEITEEAVKPAWETAEDQMYFSLMIALESICMTIEVAEQNRPNQNENLSRQKQIDERLRTSKADLDTISDIIDDFSEEYHIDPNTIEKLFDPVFQHRRYYKRI